MTRMSSGGPSVVGLRRSARNKGQRWATKSPSPSVPVSPREERIGTDTEVDAVVVEIDGECEDQPLSDFGDSDNDVNEMVPVTRLKYSRFKGDGSQDVDDWFGEFEATALANQEDPLSKRRIFQGLLKGEALKWFQDVSETVRANWEEFTTLFLRTFREAGGEARALGRLSKMTMKPRETVRRYGQRVKGLIQKLTTDIAQSVQVEWYVAGFPEEMGFQIRQSRPTTLAEAMEAAQHYENSAQSIRKSVRGKGTKHRASSSKSGRKHRRRSKYSSSSSSSASSSSASSSDTETSSDDRNDTPLRRSALKNAERSSHVKFKEVKVEKESKELMKSIEESLEAIKVNLAENRKPRRAIPTIRSNIWCTKCGQSGHYTHECNQPTTKRVQFVDQEGAVFWAEEVEEEEESPTVYQVVSNHGRGNSSGYRPANPPPRLGAGRGYLPPVPPRYQLYPDRSTGVCYNCGAPDHYANVCPHPKVGGQGAPLVLPCQNCHQYGHAMPQCPQPQQPRPVYKQVEVPPREQTALNYGRTEGVENQDK